MTERICKTCRFRDGVVCRRYPPQATTRDRSNYIVNEFAFPAVNSRDWCGEWQEVQDVEWPHGADQQAAVGGTA